jgi:flagellar biosynthetic protein FliO
VTFSSVIGAVLTLGLVLTLVVVTMRLLRRVTNGPSGIRQAGPRLEVVQRLALGPRQGIAVVRVGEQLLAVSVGDGGVRTLAELEREAIERALTVCGGDKSRAAQELGISRAKIYQRLKEWREQDAG